MPKRARAKRPSASERGARYGLNQADIHTETLERHEVVCHESAIVGWHEAGVRAAPLVGPDTSSLRRVRVFITARREEVYAHSNFVKPDCHHVTKLATNQPHPLEVLAENLVGTEETFAEPRFRAEFGRAMVEDFTYLIDEPLLLDGRYAFLVFTGLRRAFVVLPDSSQQPLDDWRRAHAQKASVSPPLPANPWMPGLFYVVAFLSVVLGIRLATGPMTALMIPAFFACGLLALTIIGALTLKNQRLLPDKTFLELMRVTLQRMPLLRSVGKAAANRGPPPSHSDQ